MAAKRSESFSMTVHLGPFRPERVQDDVRTTLRAVMSLEKRKLGRATMSTKGNTMKVHGKGITVSTHGKEGWIHLTTDIDSPVSPKKLAMANRYINSIAAYFTELFSGMMKVKVTTTITESLPPMRLTKSFSPSMLREMGKALGFEVIPNGIWLVSKSEGEKRAIVVTGYKKRSEVDYIHYFPTGSEIRKDLLMETYKKLKEMIRKSLPILQAD